MGASLFSAHMGQHLLLVLVAAPLFVWNKPLAPLLRGMRPRWRKAIGVTAHSRPMKTLWQWFVTPAIAATLHIIALGIWHLPALYGAALASTNIHVLEHASFFMTAFCFWWAIWYSEQYGARILSVFSVMMVSGLLGVLITFAPLPWYNEHAQSVVEWGLTPRRRPTACWPVNVDSHGLTLHCGSGSAFECLAHLGRTKKPRTRTAAAGEYTPSREK